MGIIKDIKIKDTILDRRYKLTEEDVLHIKKMRRAGMSYGKIAKIYGVTAGTVRVRTMSAKELKRYREIFKENAHNWYHNKTKEERTVINKSWKDSTIEYKEKLFEIKIDSMNNRGCVDEKTM